jgi:hypothetical protein
MLTGRDQKATEALAMQVVIEHERGQGHQVFDVHERNLGYDLSSSSPSRIRPDFPGTR